MKKILLSAMALVASMSVNAQTEMGVIDAEALGLSSDAVTVPAGTKLIETESVVCTLTDLNDQECKATGLSKNDVKVNGVDFGSKSGIQGNTNGPGTAASTGEFPTQGCIYHFVPNKDGYLYVIHKASANKNYVVFEEKTRIPYIFASESGGYDLNTVEGATVTDAEGITTIAPEFAILQARMIIDNDPASESSNGAGTCAIKFPVYEGLAYDVLATGSKMTMAGFIFDTTGDATIVCAREDGDITLLENGQLPGAEPAPQPGGDVLSLIDKFTGCWNGAETATANADGSITYAAKQWGGLAAWLAGETPADYSAYDNIVFEFAEPTPCAVQGFVQYGDQTDNKTWVEAGTTKAVCALGDGKAAINQIALQCAEDASLTITKIYLEKAGSTAIQSAKAQAKAGIRYNLAGQKVDANYKGIVIENGKKMMVK